MTPQNVNVREARVQDHRIIAQFVIAMARESEGVTLDTETVEAGVSAVLNDRAKGVYYVAETDEGLVGQALVTTEWSDWNCREYRWLQSVYVLPQQRRRDVFRSIYHFILSQARDASVASIRLYVHRDNEGARMAYLRLGMQDTGYTVFEQRI